MKSEIPIGFWVMNRIKGRAGVVWSSDARFVRVQTSPGRVCKWRRGDVKVANWGEVAAVAAATGLSGQFADDWERA